MSFNLGRPEEVSILDLANRIASLTKTSVIHGEGYPGDSSDAYQMWLRQFCLLGRLLQA